MRHASVEHHELLTEGRRRRCGIHQGRHGKAGPKTRRKLSGWSRSSHAHGAVETRVVIDCFGDGFRLILHDPTGLFHFHSGHFGIFDLLVRLLTHRDELGLLLAAENGVEVELEGGLKVIAIVAHGHFLFFHHGRGRGVILDHGVFPGRNTNFSGNFLVVGTFGPLVILEVSGNYDAVIDHLANHAAGGSGGEVFLALLPNCKRSVRGKSGAAVDIGESDHAHQGAEVISAGDEFLSEEIQRRGMVHAVVVGEVVERFDKSTSDQFGPDAVHEGAGEVVVARIGDEVGELLAKFAGAVNIAMNVEFAAFSLGFLENGIVGAADVGFDRIKEGIEGKRFRRLWRPSASGPAWRLRSV